MTTMTTFEYDGTTYRVRARTKHQRDQVAPSLHAALLRALGYDLNSLEDNLNPVSWMMVTQFVAALQTVSGDGLAWLVSVDAPMPVIHRAYATWKAWIDDHAAWMEVWQGALSQVEGGADNPKVSAY